MTHGEILLLMTALFLIFGYMGVPVVFALMAGVLTACLLTPISMQSMIGQMFHGIDSEILLAVPFFLLVGELYQPDDRLGADHGRAHARRTGAGCHAVQHVFCWHFRFLNR
jgi:Tripartite ATP-independent periplasmic transporter, DctM component